MPQGFLPQASDGFGGAYPLLTASLTSPVFHLLDPHSHVSATIVSAPNTVGIEVSVPQSPLLGDGVEQDMAISGSSLGDTLSQDDVEQFHVPSVSHDCPDFQSHEHILKLILDLGKSDHPVRDVPKPRSSEVEMELLTQSGGWGGGGGGALTLDSEMQEEMSAAFLDPSPMAKITNSSSPYKVPNDLYTTLFKAAKVQEEMGKAHVLLIPYQSVPIYGRQ